MKARFSKEKNAVTIRFTVDELSLVSSAIDNALCAEIAQSAGDGDIERILANASSIDELHRLQARIAKAVTV